MIWSYFLKRATLTTKGTESLELDERRGCLFQAGWKLTTDRKVFKNVWTALLISRVLVSALTLSLKWLSNLSMGNRGFPPGLLADALNTFFRLWEEAIGTGLTRVQRTRWNLATGLRKRLDGIELYLLLVLPSLWLTGFYSFFHTSGGRGRRVQLPLVMAIPSWKQYIQLNLNIACLLVEN